MDPMFPSWLGDATNCAGSSVIEAFASLSIGIRVQSVSVATFIAMGSHWQAALVESRGTIATAYPARSLWMSCPALDTPFVRRPRDSASAAC